MIPAGMLAVMRKVNAGKDQRERKAFNWVTTNSLGSPNPRSVPVQYAIQVVLALHHFRLQQHYKTDL